MLTENLPDRIECPTAPGIYPSHTRMLYAELLRREGYDIARRVADARAAAILRYIHAAGLGLLPGGVIRRVRIFLCSGDIPAMLDEVSAAARCGVPATFVTADALPISAAGAVRLDGQILYSQGGGSASDRRYRIERDDVYIDCLTDPPDDIFSAI